MKKLYLLVFMVMILCLTACGTDKKDEALESSSLVSETETIGSVEKEQESQPKTETAFELTEQRKNFLTQMCKELNDFNSQTTMDELFWRDFLFSSYTGVSEGAETEEVHREDSGFDETVVKISLQEAQAYTKLVFGVDLPDVKPSFEDMDEGQTAFFYQDGYYYIGVSDFPNTQYTFIDYEESDNSITVRYSIDFEDESNVGVVCFSIVPEANENGFIITSKSTEFFT
ncbi:MAG: hypothetical protein HDQ97_02880 [Lachnospiraceae bacterium]|nr:hypothetical protein [Lachnospiraceae bacterium]